MDEYYTQEDTFYRPLIYP